MNHQLKVDYDALDAQSQMLNDLRVELDTSTMLGVVDQYRGYLGSGMLADHMDGVMNNWNRKHQELAQQLDDLSTATNAVIESFVDTDTKLGQTASGGQAK